MVFVVQNAPEKQGETGMMGSRISKITVAFVLGGLVFVSAPAADATARESTKSYTCAGLKQMLRKRGAAVLNTKNSNVYERFVAHRGYCQYEEVTRRVSVPTKNGVCRISKCEPRDAFLFDGGFGRIILY